ncbi:MAG: DUF1963 domain-containing protein [Bacteroidales bacterium]|jgi:uncharacterized protein YwqG|nr:DUF1963 domain-containing protein [Prevotella sp.]MBR3028527.1 DUF1963 domain-containing protein [Bacteroidales bacterium]
MSSVCYINIYEIPHDRGVNMGRSLMQQYEIPEEELVVGQELPHWNHRKGDNPVVTFYDGRQLGLKFRGLEFTVKTGEEVLLSEGIRSDPESAMWGIQSEIQHCVKLARHHGIDMKLTPSDVPPHPGSSYFWDAPQLPSEDMYPFTTDADGNRYPMQFICQINCANLPDNDWLPKRGMLWFFGEIDYFLGYDVKQPYGLGKWPEYAVKVIYADVPTDELKRINPFQEDDMIPPHVITFSEGPVRGDGFRLLGKPYEEDVDNEFGTGWVQLLQLDTDANDYFDLRFYDMGLLYLMINVDQLQEGIFSRIRPYMTSL